VATFSVPVLCWLVTRDRRPVGLRAVPRAVERAVAWCFSLVLIGVFGVATYLRFRDVPFSPVSHLPMQLCDWAMVVTVLALLARSQTAFEIAYCWGLAGTFQALLTPAWPVDGGIAAWCFLIFHSIIPAAVIWLLLMGRRPSARAWRRVGGWSQVYFVSAIVVNAMTGANYGFLARRPDRPSLLDKFPDPAGGWAYVLAVDAFAMTLFALMLLPWRAGRHQARTDSVSGEAGA
jgi:hypothetical integral membrane protein (TIGR02206 family)